MRFLSILSKGQISFGDASYNPIQVSIDQFYGIEINDFAVTVALDRSMDCGKPDDERDGKHCFNAPGLSAVEKRMPTL